MKSLFLSVLIATVLAVTPNGDQRPGYDDRLQKLEQTLSSLGRQMMMQQLFVEERIRSDGQSGIKQTRHNQEGTRPYYGNTHSGHSTVAIHNHGNYDRTVGMGEFVGVMNGVEFRTRHNDYKLRMPSRTSKAYHATENIPFPDVPPEVLNKPTVQAQIYEMRKWFAAWKTQNHRQRDYRKYFKPVLCYLEGGWTAATKSINEPFQSDRHHIDADTWFDLQEKIRYTAYTGSKSILENYAFLPTTIMGFENDVPRFAQWNYRILCHPLKSDIPLKYLKPVDELSSRFPKRRTFENHVRSTAGRFHINVNDFDTFEQYSLLDKLMHEIPGQDNYPGNLTENNFGSIVYDLSRKHPTALNVAYYHRWYKVANKGAMGVKRIHRGYSDENLFVAKTTQPRIANMSITVCKVDPLIHKRVCTKHNAKYTYAIPLEIIYLTPLSKWNPYNLTFRGDPHSAEGRKITQNGRNGGLTPEKAFDGISTRAFYHTPHSFFQGSEVERDPADTARGEVGVLDPHGRVARVSVSGIRIFFPNITGVGILRQRYPIFPVHGEGSAVWKEVDALKDMMMHMNTYKSFFVEPPEFASNMGTMKPVESRIHFTTSVTNRDPPGAHSHDVFFTSEEMIQMQNNTVTTHTSQDNGHSHALEVTYDTTLGKYVITLCDSQPVCWDGHTRFLYS